MSDFKLYEGSLATLSAADYRFAVVAARFNGEIVNALLSGAVKALQGVGAKADQISVFRVPGAFELPLCCQKLAEQGKVDALIALGCVIRGDTPHFDYVCSESARGIMDVGLKFNLPVINGILTVDNVDQAKARAGAGGNNKGVDAAYAAIEMLTLFDTL